MPLARGGTSSKVTAAFAGPAVRCARESEGVGRRRGRSKRMAILTFTLSAWPV
jgi:hypothetical protein